MKKLGLILVLCFLMLCTSNTYADHFEVTPLMDYIAQAKGNLYIDSSGTATVLCSVYGYQGTTTRVEITANLQQYKNGTWTTIKSFSAESDSHRTSLSETHHLSKGYAYRVRAVIKAYRGSSVETRTVTSSESRY